MLRKKCILSKYEMGTARPIYEIKHISPISKVAQ
jgi:hypothetical protein